MPIIGSSKLQITGDITASGAIVAEEFKTDFVSGSILYNSGSSKFGDTRDDTHEFTGSISLSGSNVSFLGGSQVGIGTSSPDNELHLTDGSAGSVSANSNTQFTVESSGHAGIQFLSPNSSNNIIYFGDVNDNDVGYVAYQHSSNIFNIVVNTTEAMFIDGGNGQDVVFPVANQKISGSVSSTGSFGDGRFANKVGIGTTSPVHPLQVNVDNDGIMINNSGQTNGEFAALYFTAHGVAAPFPKMAIASKRTGDYGVGDMYFAVDSNADEADINIDSDAKMVIKNNGNVGIGTTVPSQPLTVAGNISGSGNFNIDGTGELGSHLYVDGNITASGNISASGTVFANTFESFGGDSITIDDSMNVVGNVSGSVDSTGSFGSLVVADKVQGDTLFGGTITIHHTTATLTIKSTDASNGDAKLDLVSDAGATNEDFWSIFNEGTDNDLSFKNGNHDPLMTIAHTTGHLTTTGSIISNRVNGVISGSSTSTGSFGHGYIADNLYVGAQAKIYTDGTTVRFVNRAAGDTLLTTFDSNEKIHLDSDGYMKFEVAGSEAVRINSSGQVGIGTTTPDSNIQLHIQDATYGRALIESTGTNSNAILYLKNDAATYDVRINGDDKFAIYDTNNTAYSLYVDSSGNLEIPRGNISGSSTSTGSFGQLHIADEIGIGTTSPAGTLHVAKSNSGALGPVLLIDNSAGGNGDSMALIFSSGGNTYQRAKIVSTADTSSPYNGSLEFYTGRSDQGTLAEKMRINSSGHVLFQAANQKISGSSTSTGSFGRVEADIFSGSFHGQIGARYVHTESTPATTWTITHNLGSQYPNVTVYDESDEMVIPTTVTATNTNTLTLTFGIGVAGVAMVGLGGHSSNQGRAYVHSQDSAATSWPVTHSFGEQYPAITVYDESNKVIIPENIHAVGINHSEVFFDQPTSGKAHFSVGNGLPSINASNAGNYMRVNSDGTNIEYTTSTANVTGSFSVTGSVIVTGSIGIGHKSPATELHVVTSEGITVSDATTDNTDPTTADGTTTKHITLARSAIRSHAPTNANANMVFAMKGGNSNAGAIKFQTGNTETDRVSIDRDGNVGIGTNSPATMLEVSGSEPSIRISDTAAGKHFNMMLASGGGVSKLRFNSETHSNTLMVTNDNRVGMGVGSPAVNLHIEDSQTDTDFTNNSLVGGVSVVISNQQSTDNTFSSLQFIAKEAGGTDQSAAIVVESTSATSYTPKLHIVQRTASNTQTTRLTIDETGKVGIGTTSPASRLHLYNLGDATDNELLIECDSSSGGATGNNMITMKREDTNRANEIKFVTHAHGGSAVHKFSLGQTDSDETAVDGTQFYIGRSSGGANPDFVISSAGKIGIGTASPEVALDVVGDVKIKGDLTAETLIISSSVTNLTTQFASGSTRFGDSMDDTHQITGSLSITGSGDEVFVVKAAQATVPRFRVDNDSDNTIGINCNPSNAMVDIRSTGNDRFLMSFLNGSGTDIGGFYDGGGSLNLFVEDASSNRNAQIEGSTGDFISNAGGFISKGANAKISGSITSTGSFGLLQVGEGKQQIRNNSLGSDRFEFFNNGGLAAIISGSGTTALIATNLNTVPAGAHGLYAHRDVGDARVTIDSATSSDAQLKFVNGGSDSWTVYSDGDVSGDPLRFYDAGGGTVMMSLVGGQVTIGDTTPQSLLHIEDTVSTTLPTSITSGDSPYTPYEHELLIKNTANNEVGSFAGIAFYAGQNASTEGLAGFGRIAVRKSGAVYYASEMHLFTRNSQGNTNSNLMISPSGSVGIGVGSSQPEAYLHVVPTGSFSGNALQVEGTVNIGTYPLSSSLSTHDFLKIGGNAVIASYGAQGPGGEVDFNHNVNLVPNGQYQYISTDEATMFRMGGGKFQFRAAAAGNAGAQISFTESAQIKADGTYSGSVASTGSFGELHLADDAHISGRIGINTDPDAQITTKTTQDGSNVIVALDHDGNTLMRLRDSSAAALFNLYDGGVESITLDADWNGGGMISGSAKSTGSFGAGYIDNKLGIGTTSPGATLDVQNATEGVFRVRRGSIYTELAQNSSGGVMTIDKANGDAGIQLVSYGNSYFVGGNVGIGTTSPQSALSFVTNSTIGVATTDGSDNGLISISGGGGAGNARGGTIYLSGNERSTYGGRIDIDAGNTDSSGIISMVTATVERMVIDYAGNVGIGVTAPVTALDVHSAGTENAATFGMADDGNAYVVSRVGEVQNRVTGYMMMVGSAAIDGWGSTNALAGIVSTVLNDGGTLQGDLKFYTNSGDSLTEHFNIAGNGDLTGTDTAIGSISDERTKQNIQTYSGSLSVINTLRPVTFEWKSDEKKSGRQRGFIAQEITSSDAYWVRSGSVSSEQPDYEYLTGAVPDNFPSGSRMALISKLTEKDTIYVSAIQELTQAVRDLRAMITGSTDLNQLKAQVSSSNFV